MYRAASLLSVCPFHAYEYLSAYKIDGTASLFYLYLLNLPLSVNILLLLSSSIHRKRNEVFSFNRLGPDLLNLAAFVSRRCIWRKFSHIIDAILSLTLGVGKKYPRKHCFFALCLSSLFAAWTVFLCISNLKAFCSFYFAPFPKRFQPLQNHLDSFFFNSRTFYSPAHIREQLFRPLMP